MRRSYGRRVIATLAAAGVAIGFASNAEARGSSRSSDGTRTRTVNRVSQDADSFVGLFQRAASNTGFNFQGNLTAQGNALGQDSDSNANGGDADASTGSGGGLGSSGGGTSVTADAAAAAAEAIAEAIATGGAGGDALAENVAEQANEAESTNALVTGDAESINESSVEVEQSQALSIENSITQNIEAALASATAGGATATLPVFPDSVEATIINNVEQDADSHVIVHQDAASNTGGNVQGNVTVQGNIAVQDSDADANGGDADAYTGGSSTVEADGVAVAAASSETVADALGGDGGDAEAVNDAVQENTSDSGNVMSTGDATSENSSEVSVSQDAEAEITSEVTQDIAAG